MKNKTQFIGLLAISALVFPTLETGQSAPRRNSWRPPRKSRTLRTTESPDALQPLPKPDGTDRHHNRGQRTPDLVPLSPLCSPPDGLAAVRDRPAADRQCTTLQLRGGNADSTVSDTFLNRRIRGRRRHSTATPGDQRLLLEKA